MKHASWYCDPLSLCLVVLVSLVPTSAVGDEAEALIALTEELAREVETLRGWEFKHPVEKAFLDEDGLREFLDAKLDELYAPEEIQDIQSFLNIVGALPEYAPLRETITEFLLDQVGGFYDPSTRTFYLVDRGVALHPFVARLYIVHELTHALDDQYVRLDALMEEGERTEDRDFVSASLVEGSATALMTTYLTRAQTSGEVSMQDLQAIMDSESERTRKFIEAPAYFQTILAGYTCGMGFLLRGNLLALMGGGDDVAGENFLLAAKDRPASSEQILHPEKYWDPETRDHPVTVSDADVEGLCRDLGFEVAARNVAGEALSAILTFPLDREFQPMSAGLAGYWTNGAATGWGGDRFYLLEGGSPEGAKPAVWFTLWDSETDRDEFFRAYAENRPDPDRQQFMLGKRGAVYLYGMTVERGRAMEERIRANPPEFLQDGKSWNPEAGE